MGDGKCVFKENPKSDLDLGFVTNIQTQSHLGKNAYTTYVLDTGSFLHKHMLIPHFTWYKHMLIPLMNLYEVVSGISIFS